MKNFLLFFLTLAFPLAGSYAQHTDKAGSQAETEINQSMWELNEFLDSNEFDQYIKQFLQDLGNMDISLKDNILHFNGETIDLNEKIIPALKQLGDHLQANGKKIEIQGENIENLFKEFGPAIEKIAKEFDAQIKEADKKPSPGKAKSTGI